MTAETHPLPGPDRRFSRTALTSYFLLIALTLAWEGWLAPKNNSAFWLTVKLLPLLVPLAGLLRSRLRSYLWATLIAMLYLTEGLVLLWTERLHDLSPAGIAPWALAETLLSTVFILSAALHVRKQRAAGASLMR